MIAQRRPGRRTALSLGPGSAALRQCPLTLRVGLVLHRLHCMDRHCTKRRSPRIDDIEPPQAGKVCCVRRRWGSERQRKSRRPHDQSLHVRVHHDARSTLILHRFGDTLGELDPASSLQVHHGWWAESGAVTGTFLRGGKRWLKLSNDLQVPVSRMYLRSVAEQGRPRVADPTKSQTRSGIFALGLGAVVAYSARVRPPLPFAWRS